MKTAKPVNYDFKITCNKNSHIIDVNGEHMAEATEITEAFAFIAHQIKKKDMKSYRVFIILGGIENQITKFDPDSITKMYGEKFNYGDEDDDDDSVIFSESEKSSPLQNMSIDKLICIIHAQTDYIKMLQTHSGELLDMLTNNLVEAAKQEK